MIYRRTGLRPDIPLGQVLLVGHWLVVGPGGLNKMRPRFFDMTYAHQLDIELQCLASNGFDNKLVNSLSLIYFSMPEGAWPKPYASEYLRYLSLGINVILGTNDEVKELTETVKSASVNIVPDHLAQPEWVSFVLSAVKDRLPHAGKDNPAPEMICCSIALFCYAVCCKLGESGDSFCELFVRSWLTYYCGQK